MTVYHLYCKTCNEMLLPLVTTKRGEHFNTPHPYKEVGKQFGKGYEKWVRRLNKAFRNLHVGHTLVELAEEVESLTMEEALKKTKIWATTQGM